MKFIGHLELMRYLQSAVRRTEIPVKYDEGMHQRMVMSFAMPLGVGPTSSAEYMDIELVEPISSEKAMRQLGEHMCEGLEILDFREVDGAKKQKAMTIVAAADYEVSFREGFEPDWDWKSALSEFCARETIPWVKETKKGTREVDMKEWIYEMRCDKGTVPQSPSVQSVGACETTPDTVVKVYRLKYAEAEEVSDMINDLIGNAPSSKNNSKGNQNAAARGQGGTTRVTTPTGATAANTARKSANQRTGEAKPGELSKENTTVLADKRINGLVVMTNKELVPVVEGIIEAMDVKLSQVLIETVIIEVTLGDDLQTGIDWVQRGRQRQYSTTDVGTGTWSQNLTGYSQSSTLVTDDRPMPGSVQGKDGYWWNPIYEFVENTVPVTTTSLVRDRFVNNGSYSMSGGGGTGSGSLSTLVGAGLSLSDKIANLKAAGIDTSNMSASEILNLANQFGTESLNPIGAGINYFLKSDKLNIAAVIAASKTDSRAKYIASPVVMTVDNKEATIDATENRQFLTGWSAQSGSYGNSGQPTPNYSAKDIGIKIKITPKINPNGTVMLEVEEEYSQYVRNGQSMLIPQSGNYTQGSVDLAVERKMSADVLLENMQTVVLGGLTETSTAETETGIPILKDIPWIGKWLFGTVTKTEARKELLIFLTPYVLDEADAAQAEALRRKKALSDPRPWDDHGWSASPLADPVSKKEQMRKLKDEWKSQDEERKTKLAIEDEKVKRAKALEQMSKEERNHWLEMHKDELDEEDRKEELRELKEKMKSKDDETQEALHKLAAEIRERKLVAAEAEIKEADEAAQAENENAKLKAEKTAKEEAAKAEPEAEPAAEASQEEPKAEPMAEESKEEESTTK